MKFAVANTLCFLNFLLNWKEAEGLELCKYRGMIANKCTWDIGCNIFFTYLYLTSSSEMKTDLCSFLQLSMSYL